MLRLVAAALLVVALPPMAASAAPTTWYRTGAASGSGAYRTLAGAPTSPAADTVVSHGASTGTFVFSPGASTATTGVPSGTGTGLGWATPAPNDGTIPAGTWRFDAQVATTAAAGTASGRVLVALYAVGPSGSRRLHVAQSSTDVLSAGGATSVSIAASLGAISLQGERLAVEWFLNITSNSSDPSASTSLQQGGAGDVVVAPGGVTSGPLQAPLDVRVTSSGDTRIDVAWTAPGDPRVTGYVVRWALDPAGPWSDASGILGGTSFAHTGLTNGTRYFHTVVSVDAGGGRSGNGNVTSSVPIDDVAPATPTGLAVASDGSGRLRVTWNASTSTDVTAYEVQRSGSAAGQFTSVGQVAATTFTQIGLPAGSTWWYRLVAIDDDGLRSPPTGPASGKVAPAAPTGLRVTAVADGAVALAWNSGSGSVAAYVIERATGSGPFAGVGSVTGTEFTDGGLANGTSYRYRVRAVDPDGNASSPSATVTGTPTDTGRPPTPVSVSATPLGGDRVRLGWSPGPGDSSGVVGYRVLRSVDGGPYSDVSGLVTGTRHTDGPRPVGVVSIYTIVSEDAAGRRSLPSNGVDFIVPPEAPTGLRLQAVSESSATLVWDPLPYTGVVYRVLRFDPIAGTFVQQGGFVTTPSFTQSDLVVNTTYRYAVQAEVGGVVSPLSPELSVVTRDGPPVPPIGVLAEDRGVGGSIQVSWTPNEETDLAGYEVERQVRGEAGWVGLATVETSILIDDTTTDGTEYVYRVRAVDQAGFRSDPSLPSAPVTSTDVTPPPAPGAPVVTSVGGLIRVVWGPTPGATRYRVQRSAASGGPYTTVGTTPGTRTFTDTDVLRGQTYYYVVIAEDGAGNVSPASPERAGRVTSAATGLDPGAPGPTTPPAGDLPSAPGASGPGGQLAGDPGVPATGDITVGAPASPVPDPTAAPPGPTGATGAGNGGAGPASDAVEFPAIAGPISIPGLGDSDATAAADDAFAEGRIGETLTESAREVVENVGEAARVLSVPLFLLLLLALYLVVQGRVDRAALVSTVETATGAVDDDRRYYL